eukprot:1847748-Rhodomonas_salina.1
MRREAEHGTDLWTWSHLPSLARLTVQLNKNEELVVELYSTCASPVVPHPSARHAHGCLASEIGRDPAFPT